MGLALNSVNFCMLLEVLREGILFGCSGFVALSGCQLSSAGSVSC